MLIEEKSKNILKNKESELIDYKIKLEKVIYDYNILEK